MPLPLFETMQGTVDGVNSLFSTVSSYLPASLTVFQNGQAKIQGGSDGWTLIAPRSIRFNIPPEAGDDVQAWYLPA